MCDFMKFRKKVTYFIIQYSFLMLLFILAYLSYFIFEHPDTWTHQSTHFKRILGYYTAPFGMVLSLFYPLYIWFKYRKIEVNLADNQIKFNGKLIDISSINEIYIKYIYLTDSNEYTLYEVIPMEHRKLLKIPMFFVPDSKEVFESELNEFCERNNVELVKSKYGKKECDI
jgi:hypothetical protein